MIFLGTFRVSWGTAGWEGRDLALLTHVQPKAKALRENYCMREWPANLNGTEFSTLWSSTSNVSNRLVLREGEAEGFDTRSTGCSGNRGLPLGEKISVKEQHKLAFSKGVTKRRWYRWERIYIEKKKGGK